MQILNIRMFRPRTDYVWRWKESNPILRHNEIGRVKPSGEFKIGDGKTDWNDLEYSTILPEEVYINY